MKQQKKYCLTFIKINFMICRELHEFNSNLKIYTIKLEFKGFRIYINLFLTKKLD